MMTMHWVAANSALSEEYLVLGVKTRAVTAHQKGQDVFSGTGVICRRARPVKLAQVVSQNPYLGRDTGQV